MTNPEHNIVSILYSLKGIIESHLAQDEEGRFASARQSLDHAEKVLKKAYSQADFALEMARRLNHLSKLAKAVSARRRASLRKVWDLTIALIEKDFSLNHIEIINRIPYLFPLVFCDRSDFKEILYNLIKNAVQAMSANFCNGKGRGKLIIRACLALSEKDEFCAVITIADTGPGIRKDILPLLFRPFCTTKPEGEGNGIGLYLTRELVKKNSGDISVSSFKDDGTTFTLRLPIA